MPPQALLRDCRSRRPQDYTDSLFSSSLLFLLLFHSHSAPNLLRASNLRGRKRSSDEFVASCASILRQKNMADLVKSAYHFGITESTKRDIGGRG
jgi:hypothetical protein